MGTLGEIIRASLSYSSPNASEGQNVFHWIITEGNIRDEIILSGLVAWATNQWHEHWQNIASISSVLESMNIQVVNTDGTILRNIGEVDLALPGLGPQDNASAAAVAALLTAPTDRPQATGKKYIPFIMDNSVDNGVIDSTALVSLALLIVEWLVVIETADVGNLTPGLLSRSLLAFEEFLGSGVVDNVPSYQRRRKPGVGI